MTTGHETMADVLAAHQPTSKLLSPSDVRTACLCGAYVQDDEAPTFHNTWIIAHQAAALSAAGFGPAREAQDAAWHRGMSDQLKLLKAEAWDEGRDTAHEELASMYRSQCEGDDCDCNEPRVNPYRKVDA